MVRSSVSRISATQRRRMPRAKRMWRIHARRTILATGAIERPMVFSGNDRPGVMLAGAARTYLTRYAVKPAEAPVIQTSSDDGWRTLNALIAAQTPPVAIIDSRETIRSCPGAGGKIRRCPASCGSADRWRRGVGI